MKVSVEILKRVYESLQEQGQQSDEKDLIDPESHLYIINAFEMPLWHWSQENGTFQKLVGFLCRFADASDICPGYQPP
jgi:DNA polymerase epsilon subunit 2